MESPASSHGMAPEREEVTEDKGADTVSEQPTAVNLAMGSGLAEVPFEDALPLEAQWGDRYPWQEEVLGNEMAQGQDIEVAAAQAVLEKSDRNMVGQKELEAEEMMKGKGEENKGEGCKAQQGVDDKEDRSGKVEEGSVWSLDGDNEPEVPTEEQLMMRKTSSFMKTVRFQDPSEAAPEEKRDSSGESLFPDYETEEWTASSFEELFMAEDWINITDDHLLRKKVQEPARPEAMGPAWGHEVTLKMQGVLEDRMVVEKDTKLVFVIGEGDVNQALEECAISMKRGEITLLLADSQYTYGLLGREPDIPAWAPILYQLQLLDFRDKPDPLSLLVADRIRIGNHKRERGNFFFQREEYSMAARAYCMALDVLTTHIHGDVSCQPGEEEEVNDQRVKCLNNLATAQLKLDQFDEALHTSRDVLFLDPLNVKALFRAGKLLSDKGEYEEAMELLKKALKLEPATKAIHAELSKLVKRQSGGNETQKWKAKPAQVLGDNIAPFVIPPKKKPSGISWKFLLGALVVALGSLVTSVVLTARN